MLNKIGGKEKLVKILKKNAASPYGNCNCGKKWLPKIEDTVEALNQFATKFDQPKINSLVAGMTNPHEGIKRGALQELKGIRNQIDVIENVQVTLPGTSRIADALLTLDRYKEIKSTSKILKTVGSDKFPQFQAYLLNIDNITDLKYAFDKEILKAPIKAGGLELVDDIAARNFAREQMQEVFKNKAREIFNTKPNLFTDFQKLDGSGTIEVWEDLFDLANDASFVEHSIIKNLVEIQ